MGLKEAGGEDGERFGRKQVGARDEAQLLRLLAVVLGETGVTEPDGDAAGNFSGIDSVGKSFLM